MSDTTLFALVTFPVLFVFAFLAGMYQARSEQLQRKVTLMERELRKHGVTDVCWSGK